MRERIDIVVPENELAANEVKRDRLARTLRRAPTDRAPVWVDVSFWSPLAARRVTFAELISDPRRHLREQLLNYRWRCENIPDDLPIETECLTLQPDFGALRGTEFPLEIEWQENDPPKVKPLLIEPEDIDRLQIPPPGGGLNAKRITFWRGMQAAAGDFDLRLNGQPVQIRVTLTHPGGPIPSAFALCGPNLFLWMATAPDRVHRLLEIVTASHRQCIEYIDDLTGAPRHGPIWAGADTAEMVSLKMFREFVVPYYNRLWADFQPPRVFHMCGRITHLLQSIRDDLNIARLDGFGFPTDRNRLAAEWAGRIIMRGGPHPQLICDGPVDRIRAECASYLGTVGCRGGYILSEGFQLVPGTPPAHIRAMVEASNQMGNWADRASSDNFAS